MEKGLEALADTSEISDAGLSSDSSFGSQTYSAGQRTKNALTNYLVDFAAGTSFFTPIMGTLEYAVADMTSKEVIKSRLGALGMHALLMRPIGMLRNASADYFGITKESPWYKKYASDTGATLLLQVPTYSAVLFGVAETSLDKGLKALALATAVTVVFGRVYGRWQDGWRKMLGKTPAIR